MAPAWKPQHKFQWNDWSKWNDGSKWNERSQWDERSWNERSQWDERSHRNEKSEWYGYSSRKTWTSDSAEDSSKLAAKDDDATTSLSEEELLVAVQACYHQEVYPQDVLLLWMLKGYKKVGLEEIQRVGEASCGLQVEYSATSKKGFAVLMEMPPLGFSGFADDAAEHVPLSLVEQAGMMVLLGGWPVPEQTNHDRISHAAWLHSSEVLQHLTLGKCLALVNLLLASHSVLGKRAGRLVPYFQSEEYEKQENARRMCPTGLREDEVWVSCWEDLIGYLKVLLEENGGKMMSARVKNEIRARFNLEFSETALGHVSLGNLLDDPRILEHFHVRKSPPAADLILLKDYKPWKEPTPVPEAKGAWRWSQMNGDEKQKRCFQELISTGPWRQEVLLPLPCAPWEIVSEICQVQPLQPRSFAVEEV